MQPKRDITGGPNAGLAAVIAGILVLLCLLQALPEAWRNALQYERDAVMAGQWWRLLSANLIHLGWAHLALNGAALGLILWIFGPDRSALRWLAGAMLCGAATSLGVLAAAPAVQWMVGLSGLLHGLFVLGALGWLRGGDRAGWALLAVVGAKLAYEQLSGAMPLSPEIVGGPVVVDAHVWGAVGGLLAGLLEGRVGGRWRDAGSSL